MKVFNYFRTKEEAKAETEKIIVRRQLEDIARRLNKGKKLDWYDPEQDKLFLCYSSYNIETVKSDIRWRDKAVGVVYCLDKSFKDIAIKEIGEERLLRYLKGE